MCLVVGCGACISQWILFIFNSILSLLGLAIIGIGVLAWTQLANFDNDDLGSFNNTPIIIIVVGCVLTAVFFAGCCGAFCRNTCLLNTYAVVTIVLATATIVNTVFVFKSIDTVKQVTEDWLTQNFDDARNSSTIEYIQTALSCCGTTGPEYYNGSLPISCCPTNLQGLGDLQEGNVGNIITGGVTIPDDILTCSAADAYQGCIQIFSNFAEKLIKIIGQVLIWIIIIEYAAAGLALFLSCYARRR